MNIHALHTHRNLIAILVSSTVFTILISLQPGSIKTLGETNWLNAAEGTVLASAVLSWIFLILISRPTGKVTQLLVLGLVFIHISVLLNILNELTIHSETKAWLSLCKPIAAAFGIFLLTSGLYFWHKEQLVLNGKTHWLKRDYDQDDMIDNVTGLYKANLMEEQIKNAQAKKTPFSLLMVDVDNFEQFNCEFGLEQGDKLLRAIADLTLMNIHVSDFASRYAGDRFVVMLTNTNLIDAHKIAHQIEKAVDHLAYKPEKSATPRYHHVSISVCNSSNATCISELMNRLNNQMAQIKNGKYELAA